MQAAILKSGRTAPSAEPGHTLTPALPAAGYLRLPVASAVCGAAAKSTICAWAAQGRSPKPVKLSPRTAPGLWPRARMAG